MSDFQVRSKIRNVQYGSAVLQDFRVLEADQKGKVTVLAIGDDYKVTPSERFWTSLCAQYSTHGLTMNLFKLFDHAEVFERLQLRLGASGKGRLRFAIEQPNDGAQGKLLAVSSLEKPLIEYQALGATLRSAEVLAAEYGGGIVRSEHRPAHMDDFSIGPDEFSYRYVMETPIDGYGKPLIYLALLRQVCSNGAIGYAKAFRSEVGMGKGEESPMYSLTRALEAFNNEEGYAALTSRFEAAQASWASVRETDLVYKVLQRLANSMAMTPPAGATMHNSNVVELAERKAMALGAAGVSSITIDAGVQRSPLDAPANVSVFRAFTQLIGDLPHLYRVANMDAISERRRAMLASKCTVYELLNFVTEIATHWCSAMDGRALQAVVGEMISREFDLEKSKIAKPTFQDWFVGTSDDKFAENDLD